MRTKNNVSQVGSIFCFDQKLICSATKNYLYLLSHSMFFILFYAELNHLDD